VGAELGGVDVAERELVARLHQPPLSSCQRAIVAVDDAPLDVLPGSITSLIGPDVRPGGRETNDPTA
jgi:hypothetical protein